MGGGMLWILDRVLPVGKYSKSEKRDRRARLARRDVRPADMPTRPQLLLGTCYFGGTPVLGVLALLTGLRHDDAFGITLGSALLVGGCWLLAKMVRAYVEIRRAIQRKYGRHGRA